MGTVQSRDESYGKTFHFFSENFDLGDSFIYTSENGNKILFTYDSDDVKAHYFKVHGKLLIKSEESESVSFKTPERCSCKGNTTDPLPEVTFKVYFETKGLFNKQFTGKSGVLRSTIRELEELIC